MAQAEANLAEVGASVNQGVIAWMRQHSPTIVPIIAGSKRAQIEENITALKVELTDQQMHVLNAAGSPAT